MEKWENRKNGKIKIVIYINWLLCPCYIIGKKYIYLYIYIVLLNASSGQRKYYSTKSVKSLEWRDPKEWRLMKVIGLSGGRWAKKVGVDLYFTHNRHFHPSFLSISERKVLCGPGWKMPRPHLKVFFPLFPTKKHTNPFSLQSFPSILFHLQTNTPLTKYLETNF